MAKQNNRELISEEQTHTIIYSTDGREMLRFGFTRRDSEEDGAVITENLAENIECGDGTVTSAAALIRTPGGLRVCDICRVQARRSQTRVALSLTANMKTCASCRRNLCSRHAVASPIDGQYRCRSCNRWANFVHRVRGGARLLFFNRR